MTYSDFLNKAYFFNDDTFINVYRRIFAEDGTFTDKATDVITYDVEIRFIEFHTKVFDGVPHMYVNVYI